MEFEVTGSITLEFATIVEAEAEKEAEEYFMDNALPRKGSPITVVGREVLNVEEVGE